jgi:L-amino acid N-acyltransferase YncA
MAEASHPDMVQPGASTLQPMLVRLAGMEDAEEILAIYNREVLQSTATFDVVPRSQAEQVKWMSDHDGVHPAVVAVNPKGQVTGFGSLSPYRPRHAYLTTVEDSVYVHYENRNQGIGRLLVTNLVELAALHGFHAMIARISGAQTVSVRLHQACGFELVGIEKEVGRKFNRWQDVAVMQRLI